MKKRLKIFGLGIVALVILGLIWMVGVFYSEQKTEQDVRTGAEIKTEMAQVLHVFDGDTFSVRVEGKVETVGAIGIDAPETGIKYTKKECYGKESMNEAIKLLGGKEVKLESDPSQVDRDKYDRILRYVFLEEGSFFNQQMIEEGYAREYTFSNQRYKYQDLFREKERQAQEKEVGLWNKNICQ